MSSSRGAGAGGSGCPAPSCLHERWEALRLTELFGGVLPEFDYFGVTPVSRGQWERIAARSRDEADWRAVIDEAAPWAEASFARHGVISILGL